MKRRKRLALCLAVALILSLLPVNGVRAEWTGGQNGDFGNNGGPYVVAPEEWTWWTTQEPTCTQPGYQSGTSNWGNADRRQIPALGHNWGSWVTIVNPTCSQEGKQQRSCSRCGETQTQSIGYGDHSWGSWYVEQEATCYQQGINARTCQICGAYESYYTGYGSHNWSYWYVEREATCYQQGINARYCYDCGEYESYYTGYGDHNWGSWYVEQEATCNEQGINARVCQNCGEMESYYTGYADHSWGEWTVKEEPTDFSAGLWQRTCSVCGETQEEDHDPEGTLRRGDQGDAVVALQQALNKAGFDCGEADGDFGPNTEAALRQFELEKGFSDDGVAWPGVQKSLMRGNFHLPQTDYKLTLTVSEPKINIVGDNYSYEVVYDLYFTYEGSEDLQNPQAGYIGYIGEDTTGPQTGGGLAYYSPEDGPMKSGETRHGTFTAFISREWAEDPGVFTFEVTASGLVYPDDMEDETDFMPIGDYTKISLKLDPLPEPKGYVLPDARDTSAALMIFASYDESRTWYENDEVAVKVTLVNSGKRDLSCLSVDANLKANSKINNFWHKTIYEPDEDFTLAAGESVSFTYYYTVLDCKPGENDESYLYFIGDGYTLNGSSATAVCALPDPLHPEGTVGCGPASILLNADYTISDFDAVGDEVVVYMTVLNTGECELSDVCLYARGFNDNGMWIQPIPNDEVSYLGVQKEYSTSFTYQLTETDLLSKEIQFDLQAWAHVDASFITGGTVPELLFASSYVSIPLGEDTEDYYYMELTVEAEEPSLPLYQGQIIPVHLTATSPWSIDENLTLLPRFMPMVEKESHDFYSHLPDGPLEPGNSIEFTYYVEVQPQDLEAGYVSREFQVMGDKILKSGRRIRAESNADGIFYFAGAPETEASVVPVLEIVNLDETKPYYREGDELHLQWRLRNDGTKTGYMGGVFYVKSVSMGEDFKPIYDTDTIQEGDGTPINPGEAGTTAGNFTLTVPKNTGASVNMDFDFYALLLAWEPDLEELPSNMYTLTIPVLKGEDDGLIVKQKEISQPLNGEYYTPGEKIRFEVTLYNPTDQDYYNVRVTQATSPNDYLTEAVFSPTGETGVSFTHEYDVNEWALSWENLVIQFYVVYEDETGATRFYYANGDIVVCREDSKDEDTTPSGPGPAPKVPTVSVYKAEESTPEDGNYYHEGETIKYIVQVHNNSDKWIPEVVVEDVQNGTEKYELASIELLSPDGYREYHPTYEVTKDDVDRGYVTNLARITWRSDDGIFEFYGSSGLVVSDTDGIIDIIEVIGDDVVIIDPGAVIETPGTEDNKPGTEETKPGSEETKPGSEETMPGSEETKPGTDETMPGSEETKPGSDETKPGSEETKPGSDETKPGSEETKPGSDETKPSSEETKPGSEETKPGSEETKPGSDETKPGSDETQPGSEETKPGSEETKPGSEETKPGSEETKPGSEETKPGSDETKPGSDETKPGSDETKPGSEETKPGSEETKPGTDETKPGTEETKPGSEETVPETIETMPETEETVPETKESVPETEETVPETKESVPETEETVPETKESVPETEETVPETKESVPETEETVPETKESVPETEETVPETKESVPETEETIPETAETVPETEETIPETKETVPETEETVPETEETEPTKPDETKPDETKPDETKPDETKPDETKPDETKPEDPGKTPDDPGPTVSKNPPLIPVPGTVSSKVPIVKYLLSQGGPGDSSCYYNLVQRGDGVTIYEVHFCKEHAMVQELVEKSLELAKTPEEELLAWQQARALWQSKLNVMYDELLEEAALEEDEEIRKQKEDIIQAEKEAFYLQLTTYEADLMLLFPEDEIAVAKKVSDVLRYRVMDMCYETANAPKDRIDSYLKDGIELLTGKKPAEETSYTFVKLQNGNQRMTEALTENEAATLNEILKLAEKARDYPDIFLEELSGTGIKLPELAEGEEMPSPVTLVWNRAGELWMQSVNVLTTKRYLAADKTEREVITADRLTFTDWLKAREALLTLFYEDKPETRAEVMARAAMIRELLFSEAIQEAK